jgi:hypothetical protein
MEEGNAVDGDFLVRTRDINSPDYILVLIFKGKPTHHLMQKNPAGHLTINKKVYIESGDVEEVSGAGAMRAVRARASGGNCLASANALKTWAVIPQRPAQYFGHMLCLPSTNAFHRSSGV